MPFLYENPEAKRLPVDNPELLTPNMNDVYSAMGRNNKLKISLSPFEIAMDKYYFDEIRVYSISHAAIIAVCRVSTMGKV